MDHSIELRRSGTAIPDGTTYNIPDFITNPASASVAIFSEQKDRLSVANTGTAEVTLNSVTVSPGTGVMDEEFQICDSSSAVHECIALTPPTLSAGDVGDFFVHFYPVASDERSATLTINYTDDAGTHDYVVELIGYGRQGDDSNPAHLSTNASLTRHKLWGGYGSSQDEAPGSMVMDSAGNVYFTGTSEGLVASRDIFLARVNADGTLGWEMTYSTSWHDQISMTGDNLLLGDADALAIDAAGDIYVVGRAGNGSTNVFVGLIAKIDPANGTPIWTRYWHPNTGRLNMTDDALAFAVDVRDGMVLVTGQAYDYDTGRKGLPIIALSAADGSYHWSKLVVPQGSDSTAHRGHSIRSAGGGVVYLAGIDYSFGAGPFLARLTGVDATGTNVAIDWAKIVTGESAGTNFCSMDLDANGNAYLGVDRRGATTYFSVARFSADGATVTGATVPGTSGDRNNIYVVRVSGSHVYAGGKLGLAGWDTGNGDGLIARFTASTMAMDWASLYFTGKGPNSICAHTTQGLAVNGSELAVMGQVYTGNLNHYRYWGYWYDFPNGADTYTPAVSDVTSTTTLNDMAAADLVDGSTPNFDNDGTWATVSGGLNIEFQDAPDKNEGTNASNTDGDVFLMRMTLP